MLSTNLQRTCASATNFARKSATLRISERASSILLTTVRTCSSNSTKNRSFTHVTPVEPTAYSSMSVSTTGSVSKFSKVLTPWNRHMHFKRILASRLSLPLPEGRRDVPP
jgi:hypothetical protein